MALGAKLMMIRVPDEGDDNLARIPFDREKLLRLIYDDSFTDRELSRLILAVWNAPNKKSREYRLAMEALVKFVKPRLPRKDTWKHADQETDTPFNRSIENDPIVYLSQHIDEFIPTGKSLIGSLIGWLGFKAIFRSIDEYRQEERHYNQIHQYGQPIALDAPVNAGQGDVETSEQVPSLSLAGLDLILAKLDDRFLRAFTEYLRTDPDRKLVNCAMKPPNQACNCSSLVQLLYFRQPPLNQTKAAREFGFETDAGLRTHWKGNCFKLLREIAKEIALNNGTKID